MSEPKGRAWGRVAVLLIAMALSCLSSEALADAEAVVVPVVIGEGDEVFARASAVRGSEPAAFLSVTVANEVFAKQQSVAPKQLVPDELERWFAHQEQARRQLTLLDYAEAAVSLRHLQETSEDAIEALNRETGRARKVLDTCLYLVRNLWETGRHQRAEQQARQCRKLVPAIMPTRALHTPEVLGVLQRVDDERRLEGSVRLVVQSPEDGCAVRLNGLHLGETPFSVGELVPGDYRVQVECESDQPGRVHRVSVKEDTTVYIDPTLDTAVDGEPEVHLSYGSAASFSEQAERHGKGVAKMLGVSTVFLVAPEQVLRVDAEAGLVGTESVGTEEQCVDAVATLRYMKTEAKPRRGPSVSAVGSGPADDRTRARRAWGGTQVALGAASLVTSAGLYARRVRLGNDIERSLASFTEGIENTFSNVFPGPGFTDWEDARLGILITAPLGAVLMSSGESFTYRPRKKVPWWGWASGAVGAGLLGWGVAEMVTADRCPRDVAVTPACIPGQEAVDRGVVLLSAGTPLLWLPLWGLRGKGQVEVAASGRGLSVRGKF